MIQTEREGNRKRPRTQKGTNKTIREDQTSNGDVQTSPVAAGDTAAAASVADQETGIWLVFC